MVHSSIGRKEKAPPLIMLLLLPMKDKQHQTCKMETEYWGRFSVWLAQGRKRKQKRRMICEQQTPPHRFFIFFRPLALLSYINKSSRTSPFCFSFSTFSLLPPHTPSPSPPFSIIQVLLHFQQITQVKTTQQQTDSR